MRVGILKENKIEPVSFGRFCPFYSILIKLPFFDAITQTSCSIVDETWKGSSNMNVCQPKSNEPLSVNKCVLSKSFHDKSLGKDEMEESCYDDGTTASLIESHIHVNSQ